jgi:hypothetical protein
MKNPILVFLITIIFITCINIESSLSEDKSIYKTDISIIPDGIDLGMSVEELRRIRPDVQVFDLGVYLDNKKEVEDLSVGEHFLIEEIKDEGRKIAAGYLVREGRLVSIGVEVQDMMKEIRELRKIVLNESIKLFGKDYRKKVTKEGNAYVNFLIPVLIWEGDDIDVTFMCTSEYKYMELVRGSVQINISLKDKSPQFTQAEDADKEIIDFLMAPLEAEIEDVINSEK